MGHLKIIWTEEIATKKTTNVSIEKGSATLVAPYRSINQLMTATIEQTTFVLIAVSKIKHFDAWTIHLTLGSFQHDLIIIIIWLGV